MKKLCIILLLLGVTARPQNKGTEPPDYNSIEKNVKNKKSPLYFDRLFERYKRADSTLTLNEKRHLYYGYSFSSNYKPYSVSKAEEKLNRLLQKDNADRKDLELILKYSAQVLESYPFRLRMKEYRIFCLKELQRYKEASDEMKQSAMIIDAITSSGDGITQQSSFYVINNINEYEMLGVLGFEFGGRQELIDFKYDYLSLKDNSYNLKGLYFDISRSLQSFKFN
jgi:hypothetical protein